MRWALRVAWLAAGCGAANATPDTAAAGCADDASLTWDSFGRGFFTQHCNTCHAATSPDRHGAPPEVTFDAEAEVWAQRDAITAATAGDPPSMPPTGGVAADDRTLLARWLACGP
jgi:uncharacterized membrane protein